MAENDGALEEEETLYGLLPRFVAGILPPGVGVGAASSPSPLFRRIKSSFAENAPLLREASRNTGRDLLLWTRRGTPLRALLVISVGTITLLYLTGLLVFLLFFLAATLNVIIISLLISLAAVGGFLALFFASLATIYIGALSVAVFVISTMTVSTIITVLIATGWVGFLWALWIAARKSVDLIRQSLSMTGSAFLAYSSACQVHHHQPPRKEMD